MNQIGRAPPTVEELARGTLEAEKRGEAVRVKLDDGSTGWLVYTPDGRTRVFRPKPALFEAIARLEAERDPSLDDE